MSEEPLDELVWNCPLTHRQKDCVASIVHSLILKKGTTKDFAAIVANLVEGLERVKHIGLESYGEMRTGIEAWAKETTRMRSGFGAVAKVSSVPEFDMLERAFPGEMLVACVLLPAATLAQTKREFDEIIWWVIVKLTEQIILPISFKNFEESKPAQAAN